MTSYATNTEPEALEMPGCVFLAPPGYADILYEEIIRKQLSLLWRHECLFGVQERARNIPCMPVWAQNIWYEPGVLQAESIGQLASQLKGIQRNWALYSIRLHRRSALIQERLPHVSSKPLRFGSPVPSAPMGGWTLWDENTILYSPHCSSAFGNGELQLAEDKTPPSRAYLKLWEAFTLLGRSPQPGDLCLDLGSAPGGWSWVLANLGARVFSVDKAELAPEVAALPLVNHCAGSSAFAMRPEDAGSVDWLCCDVACYPSRLWTMIERWLERGQCRNYVCTLKFQGDTDHETAERFAAVPGSRLMHLACNKHELTWVLLDAHLIAR